MSIFSPITISGNTTQMLELEQDPCYLVNNALYTLTSTLSCC